MEVEYTTGEVLPALQTVKLKYVEMVTPLGMFCNSSFSKCINGAEKHMQRTKKIKSTGVNSFYPTVINWIEQMQGKKILYSYY